jgi:phosphopantothenoylcysteine decarboxylase/phosphopantothenate--cysteine ligase
MGYALAAQAAARGAQVTVVAANVSLATPPGVEVEAVGTAAELKEACDRRFEHCDILLMAAAVADFRPASPAGHKLKKTDSSEPPRLELEPTDDVLAGLSAHRHPGQTLVGFAAEHGPGAIEYGRGKLHRKGLDAVVVNDVSDSRIGFDAADNEVTILSRDGQVTQVQRAGKDEVARQILDEVRRLRAPAEPVNAFAGGRAH